MDNKSETFKWQMLELPDGITTSNGSWYHITREGIEKYMPGLLNKYPLEKLIKSADAWQKSPDILSLLLYFILVFIGVDAVLAASISVIYYILWYFNISAFVLPLLDPVINFIQNDGVVYIISAAVLIYFSFINLPAMWIGIGLLFLFKVGILRLLLKYLKKRSQKVSLEDRILNMLLIRLGMREGILTQNMQEMEQQLLQMVHYHKERKK